MSESDESVTFKEKYILSDTWQEKALTIYLYHTIMCIKYTNWTIKDTASHFEVSSGLVSENIRLAKEISSGNTKVIRCKTREDGLKLIERRRYASDRNEFTIQKFDDDKE